MYKSLVLSCLFTGGILHAQDTLAARRDTATKLNTVKVVAERVEQPRVPRLQALTLPVSASVTAQKVEATVNLVDPEDAVKYLPSVFLRKRNNGDNQATMGTRVWGVGSSARSLIFADGVPLSALIANNNSIGGPRWGLVSPAEIERIDIMHGPFSAAYAGNSMGAVMEITTRLPDRLEGSINQTQAMQRFDLYGTRDTYRTTQTNAHLGNRLGRFAFWGSANYQDSQSQPLSYVTSGSFPAGTTGAFPEKNKLGANANILGASGLQQTRMINARIKATYDVTSVMRATYSVGWWRNDADASVDPYLRSSSGESTFAGQSGFASGCFEQIQRHTSQSVSLRTDTKRDWNFDAALTTYRFDKDQQGTPVTAPASGTSFGSAGRVAVLDGTGWWTLDVRGALHRGGPAAVHTVTFGVHADRYALFNTTHNTADWRSGTPRTSVFTEGDGKTRTYALWMQDSWRLTPALRFILGGRHEFWRAYDGYNVNGSSSVNQPVITTSRFSPKASLAWVPSEWAVTASIGKAYRFATASELYQLISTGTTFTSPNPNLKPDNVLATELRADRRFGRGNAQVALFLDDVHDAIISQFRPLVPGSPTLYNYVSNVDHVRARGVEATLGGTDLLFRGLELSGSATYVDARTLATSGEASATAPAGSAIGKQLPQIPKWRGSFVTTYRPDRRLAVTIAGRYSDKLYTTLDNADVHPNTWQGFGEWFVMDAHVAYRVDRHWSAALGADNLLDRKYFLFHPFPQRTFVGNVKYSF